MGVEGCMDGNRGQHVPMGHGLVTPSLYLLSCGISQRYEALREHFVKITPLVVVIFSNIFPNV